MACGLAWNPHSQPIQTLSACCLQRNSSRSFSHLLRRSVGGHVWIFLAAKLRLSAFDGAEGALIICPTEKDLQPLWGVPGERPSVTGLFGLNSLCSVYCDGLDLSLCLCASAPLSCTPTAQRTSPETNPCWADPPLLLLLLLQFSPSAYQDISVRIP